jgi:hypothetical protein
VTTRWWDPDDRDEASEDVERTPLQLEAGELAERENACARLRKLLADGRWHDAPELADVGGLRYGGRLYEIRHGQDGAPALDVEAEPHAHGGRQVWRYRIAVHGWQGRLL